MPRYNFACYPSEKNFAAKCVAFANAQFSSLADGYLLNGRDALPHITLSQFYADESRLPELWKAAQALHSGRHDVVFADVAFRKGTGGHEGYIWAELTLERNPALTEFQSEIAALLKKSGIEPLTASGDAYHPHLTFARLSRALTQVPRWPDEAELKRPQPFHLSLGLSDENGVYMKVIQPA